QECRAVAFRQRRRHLDREADFPRRRLDGPHVHDDLAPTYGTDRGRVFLAVAVEQVNRVAGAKAANRGQVVRLGAGNRDQTGCQRTVEVKTIGHACYNTPPTATRPNRPDRGRSLSKEVACPPSTRRGSSWMNWMPSCSACWLCPWRSRPCRR